MTLNGNYVVDYEKFYNLLVKKIEDLTREKIDMENTVVYDKKTIVVTVN